MTSPRLQLLQQQLARSTVKDPEEKTEPDNQAMVLKICQAEIDAVNKAAAESVRAAQAEVTAMKAQMADMQKQCDKRCADMQSAMDSKESMAKEKMDGMCAGHAKEMKQAQAQIDALKGSLADERQARVKAETECKTAYKMCDNLEKVIGKLQMQPAPIMMPAQHRPMPSFRTDVTGRDANGRISSFLTKPAT